MTKDVFNVLRSNNVLPKLSPREQLRYLIDSEIRIYETKVEGLQGSNFAPRDKLGQQEVKDHQ